MKRNRVTRQLHTLLLAILIALFSIACQGNGNDNINKEGVTVVSVGGGTSSDTVSSQNVEIGKTTDDSDNNGEEPSVQLDDNQVAEAGSITNNESKEDETIVYRDNTPRVLVPSCPGTSIVGNELVTIDISNASEGYIGVHYTGGNAKVKFQITGPDGTTYTYDLDGNMDIIPVTGGNGSYSVGCYENISGTEYAIAYTGSTNLNVANTFGPYLYPNIYVNFNDASTTVVKGAELAATSTCELDVVNAVYQYITDNITYDYNLAETVSSGYIPSVDKVLASGKGICFDYAAVMATMLRSQGIPTRLEVGYAGQAYHAWISTYISDIGWIDGIIQFDGKSWTLMDPTFAANSEKDAFEKFIGNGNNYVTLYKY